MTEELCICGAHEGAHPHPLLSMGLSSCNDVVSVREGVSTDGRRMWRVSLADGVEEIVVELRPNLDPTA